MRSDPIGRTPPDTKAAGSASGPRWYALWTRSHCERLVHDQLAAKGFRSLFPEVAVWTWRDGRRRVSRIPLFPGYLFVHQVMDKHGYIEICKARGLVRILGERWDRLAVVPEQEVEAIRKALEAGLSPRPHPYLSEGRRVRIRDGPLAGVEGILLQVRPDKGVLVLSIDLFRRSVAVEVDCSLARAA